MASAMDPVNGRGRVQRDIGLLQVARCDFRRTATLNLENGGRSGVKTYEGLDRAAQTSSTRPTDPCSQRSRRHAIQTGRRRPLAGPQGERERTRCSSIWT